MYLRSHSRYVDDEDRSAPANELGVSVAPVMKVAQATVTPCLFLYPGSGSS